MLMLAVAPAVSGDVYPSPLELTIENVPVGSRFQVESFIGISTSGDEYSGTKFLIVNAENTSITVTIEVMAPTTPREGYKPIPDLSWVIVEPNSVTVPAKSSTEVTIYIDIPSSAEYMGKKWEVWIYPQPPVPEDSTVNPVVAARVKFETLSAPGDFLLPVIFLVILATSGGTIIGVQESLKKNVGKIWGVKTGAPGLSFSITRGG